MAVGYHPGDDSFHGWSVLVVAGQGFGVFESVAGFGQEPVVWVYFEGASSGVGGATNPDGTAIASAAETGPSLGFDGGGATRRAGHLPLVVIDREVVAGELVFAQTRVTVLGKGFDSGPMAGFFQLGAGLARPGLSNRLCEGVGSWVFSGLGLVGWGSGFRVGLGLFSSRGCRCRGFLLVCWLCFGRRGAAA